ncbi:josephin-like protein [Populus alba x Populus x berolinensis]|nr:josephin-like protein [Populus alba x Populus x berolinensis]
MSARINQVKYKPTGINQNAISIRRNSGNRVSGNRWLGRSCGFRLVKRSIMSPAVFLKHLGGKVAKALRLERRPSPGVSSSGRSRPSVAPVDAHRAEAIEDCIEFINSASLSRSNSVTANPC